MDHLHDVVGCRTLLATHLHELFKTSDTMNHAVYRTVDATVGQNGNVFTFKFYRAEPDCLVTLKRASFSSGAGGSPSNAIGR